MRARATPAAARGRAAKARRDRPARTATAAPAAPAATAAPAAPAALAAPDPARMAAAVRELLAASGLDVTSADLAATPARVARLWCDEFLSGYALEPARVLGDPVVGEADPEVVVVAGLRFHALCPHHLLPYRGVAAVAYLPRGRLLGFGRLARLVDCFTRRLTLQERATCQIAQALMDHVGVRGAGCVLRAEQLCLAIPGERHDRSEVVTTSFLGRLAGRADLKARLLATVEAPAPLPASARGPAPRPARGPAPLPARGPRPRRR